MKIINAVDIEIEKTKPYFTKPHQDEEICFYCCVDTTDRRKNLIEDYVEYPIRNGKDPRGVLEYCVNELMKKGYWDSELGEEFSFYIEIKGNESHLKIIEAEIKIKIIIERKITQMVF